MKMLGTEWFLRQSNKVAIVLKAVDILIIFLAAQLIGDQRFPNGLASASGVHQFVTYFCCLLAFIVFPAFDLYNSWRGRGIPSLVLRVWAAWLTVWLAGILLSFLLREAGELSRLWSIKWLAAGFLGLGMIRVLVHSVLQEVRRNGMNIKKVILVGYGPVGREIHRRAMLNDWLGYEIIAAYTGKESNYEGLNIATVENLQAVAEYAIGQHADEVWVTLPLTEFNDMQKLLFALRNELVKIRWVPDLFALQIMNHRFEDFMGVPSVNLNAPPTPGVRGLLKTLFDRGFAAIALILVSPLFAAIAILVKLSSPGPVFFRQARQGIDGKTFYMYKFRSMRPHKEGAIVKQAQKDDPRITQIGSFLRRTSLDELPQFLNVLFGDMSVVGPRPHAVSHNQQYKELLDRYMLRHLVKPGITGWAQINGFRGETDTLEKMAKRVEYDLYYIQNWSFPMDIKIIWLTLFKGWSGKNAY